MKDDFEFSLSLFLQTLKMRLQEKRTEKYGVLTVNAWFDID